MAVRPRVHHYGLRHAVLLDRNRKLADPTHGWKDLRNVDLSFLFHCDKRINRIIESSQRLSA
jgi:hypothetical protein